MKKALLLGILLILVPIVYSQDLSINLISTSKGPYKINDNFEYDVTVYNNGDKESDYYLEYLIEGPGENKEDRLCCMSLSGGDSQVFHKEFIINGEGNWFVTIKAVDENDYDLRNNQASIEFMSVKTNNDFVQKSINRNIVLGTLISILFFIIILFIFEMTKTLKKTRKH